MNNQDITHPDAGQMSLTMFKRRAPQDYRCGKCGRLLARLVMMPGLLLEIKCGRCNRLNRMSVEVNSTSAPVLVEFLGCLNGHTPNAVVGAAAELVDRAETVK